MSQGTPRDGHRGGRVVLHRAGMLEFEDIQLRAQRHDVLERGTTLLQQLLHRADDFAFQGKPAAHVGQPRPGQEEFWSGPHELIRQPSEPPGECRPVFLGQEGMHPLFDQHRGALVLPGGHPMIDRGVIRPIRLEPVRRGAVQPLERRGRCRRLQPMHQHRPEEGMKRESLARFARANPPAETRRNRKPNRLRDRLARIAGIDERGKHALVEAFRQRGAEEDRLSVIGKSFEHFLQQHREEGSIQPTLISVSCRVAQTVPWRLGGQAQPGRPPSGARP